jgi:SpoVK/Ycf46/Vps4 family AAA+-type ATPase
MTDQAAAQRTATRDDLQAIESELERFSRRIDPILRRHFGGRRLYRMLQPLEDRRALGRPVDFWTCSRATILITIAVFALIAATMRHHPFALVGLAAATVAVAYLIESRLVPRFALARHRFRLMRMVGAEGGGDFPHRYLVARIPESGLGFGPQQWKSARGIEPGDLVASVSDASERGVALIVLRSEGRLPVIAWDRDLYQDGVLPPLADEVKTLAHDFDAACDRYRSAATRIQRSRALRSGAAAKPRDLDAIWSGVILGDADKARLLAMARHFADGSASAARGLLLYGPPGTGKTLIAKALADSIECAFFPLSLPDLKAGYVGQSGEKVRELWTRALAEPNAIVFVDECEGVFSRRGGTNADAFTDDIVNAFIAQWDGFDKQSHVWVIGASNRRDLIDAAVLSRFDDQMQIALPDAPQRLQILRRELAKLGHAAALPPHSETATQGMSGRDLAGLAKRIAREHGDGAVLDDAALERFTSAFRRQGSTATAGDARWDSLVLDERTAQELKTTAGLLKNADAFLKRGIGVPRGLLLHGAPGTGKTQIARTLANETGLRFIAASTADIKQGWVGQSGQKVRELFERARESAPSLLFIDEIDAIAGSRGGHGDAMATEIIGQLLQEMDGVRAQPQHVFVLAATNRIDQLDPALLSRLPKHIEVPLPDADGIRRLLRVMLTGKPLAFDLETAIEPLAASSAGMSGRDLRNRIEQAELRAVHRAIEGGDPDLVAIAFEDFALR